MAQFKLLIARVMAWRPVRVFLHYAASHGPLQAAGLSYQAIFAVFAAIWLGFSVAGLVITADPNLREAFFTLLSSSVPGLFSIGGSEGAIDPRDLLKAEVLGWTGAAALVGLLFTALGWLASCRDAVRDIFGLPGEMTNVVLLKLKDVGLGIGFGAALLVSAALLAVSTQALGGLLGYLGVDDDTLIATIAARTVGLTLMFLLDAVVLAALFRVLSGLTIPLKRLLVGSLLGAAGLGILKVLGTALLGGATTNPLLASFTVIIGLLIWFNLICQVILLSASWIAVGMADLHLIADPRIEGAREERERLAAEREAAEREEAAQLLATQKKNARWGWLRRLTGRREGGGSGGGGDKTGGGGVGGAG